MFILMFAITAVTKSSKHVRWFSVGLGIYGGGFVVQALLLPSYVGWRALDAVWGLVLVAVAVFVYLSGALRSYFEQMQAAAAAESPAGATEEHSAP